MKKLILSISLICFSQLIFSQDVNLSDSLNTEKTITIKDSRIDKLNEKYTSRYSLKGYRIQIYSGNKKQLANQTRASFLRVHPKTKAHLNYKQPHYKVRVGDFKTKLEALKYKKFITKEFPNSFIVRDEIDIKELIE
ncbi:MAG: SPOR domain-containing protein [Flavobacteriales bacterium]|nr:SPOR domain-containing protein [Flavobacteriales bacterium]